jgi:hypothetical protein
VQIVLSEDERAELARRATGPGRWRADRARIILAHAEAALPSGTRGRSGGIARRLMDRVIAIGLDLLTHWYRPNRYKYQHGFSTGSGNDGK